jgi:hypothetical protein
MLASRTSGEDDRRSARADGPVAPWPALRRHSGSHPLLLFAAIAAASVLSMPLAPPAGPSLVSSGVAPQAKADKQGRIAPISAIDFACKGHASENETADCLAARGRDARSAPERMVASTADRSTPSRGIF